MSEIKHILVGNDLLLNIDHIVSANISAMDNDGKRCIKIKLTDNTVWTVWDNLERSKRVFRSIPKINDNFELIDRIEAIVNKTRVGRESMVSMEIKEILDQ